MTQQTALIKLPDFGKEIRIPEAWAEKRTKTLALAAGIVAVQDQGSYDLASEALSRITKCSGELEKERKKFSKPFIAINKTIKQVCDNEREALEAAKKRLKNMLAEFTAEQARKAAEERRKAEEEARREAERQFAAQQAAEESASILDDAPPEVITVPEAAPPEVEEAHSSSTRVTRRLAWELQDIDAVPRGFLILDSTKINAYMRQQKAAIMDGIEKGSNGTQYVPGIKFEIKTDVSGR